MRLLEGYSLVGFDEVDLLLRPLLQLKADSLNEKEWLEASPSHPLAASRKSHLFENTDTPYQIYQIPTVRV
jgi:hypothetical protein